MRYMLCLLFSYLLVTPAFADYVVSFLLGQAMVTEGAKKQKLKIGQRLAKNAVVTTGQKSRVSLYDKSAGTVINIGPSKMVTLAKAPGVDPTRSLLTKLYRENEQLRKPTTAAGIRGFDRVTRASKGRNKSSESLSSAWQQYKKEELCKNHRRSRENRAWGLVFAHNGHLFAEWSS